MVRFAKPELQCYLADLSSTDGRNPAISAGRDVPAAPVFPDEHEYLVIPGLCDVHVHFREPGFSYKETIHSGSLAAARGGVTQVCTMPNLNPVPDTAAHLAVQTDLIRTDAVIRVRPFGALTMGEKGLEAADLEAMAPDVAGFSDDGKGVQDESLMRELMCRAKTLNKVISAHCEVNSLLRGGVIHAGAWAKTHGYPGICSESEWRMIERDLRLAQETGCAYHVCHISCAESAALIRQAKREGVDVTSETCPHYLVLDEEDLEEDGRFKMNPPLRSRKDREALLEAIADGTIDMIVTDHAPHSAEEKARGLNGSPFGVVGLETAFPVLYTELVRKGVLTPDQLLDRMTDAPRKRFGFPENKDFSVWRIDEPEQIDSGSFLSMGRSTPFEGRQVYARNVWTVCDGRTVYRG